MHHHYVLVDALVTNNWPALTVAGLMKELEKCLIQFTNGNGNISVISLPAFFVFPFRARDLSQIFGIPR